jgi:gamma-glutamylcyclotransferase (GGCT)/AIG2-like uncharacterized protein YtfP
MIIYNVTVNIDEDVHAEWLSWMQEQHIPDMLATGKFLSAKMSRLLVEEEMGGMSYSIQYTLKTKEHLEQYYKDDADALRKDALRRFANKFVAFRTEMQVISEQYATIPSATEYLFTYGTLNESTIQEIVFTRILKGSKDRLAGYAISNEKIAGLYPTASKSSEQTKYIDGTLYAVSSDDILRADAYEGKAYKRIKITLESGTHAWMYLGKTEAE